MKFDYIKLFGINQAPYSRALPKKFPWKSGKRHESKEREEKSSGNLKKERKGVT
jgi:hypothetical protein